MTFSPNLSALQTLSHGWHINGFGRALTF